MFVNTLPRSTTLRSGGVGALALLWCFAAFAQGAPLDPPILDATLKSSSGEERSLSAWRGKPVILFYEDRDSRDINAALKTELFARGKAHGLLTAAAVVAIANLQAFDFFPVRQIALSYVRDEEKRVGVPILVDLKGTFQKEPWQVPPRTSSVLLLNGQGQLMWRYSGHMDAARIEAFFQTLGTLVGKDLSMPHAAP